MEKNRIECMLISRTSNEERFISIIDWNNPYVEVRINNNRPFGLPLEEIEIGDMFYMDIEIVPGTQTITITKCDVSEYVRLYQNKSVMTEVISATSGIDNSWVKLINVNILDKIERLRNNKIDTVINETEI